MFLSHETWRMTQGENILNYFFYLILIFEWFLCDFQVVNVALELVVLMYHRQTIPVNRGYPPHPTHTVSQSIFLYKILCKNISAVLRYHPHRHHTFYFADNWAQVSGYMNMFYVPKKPFIFYSSDHFAKVYLFSLSLKMKCGDREKRFEEESNKHSKRHNRTENSWGLDFISLKNTRHAFISSRTSFSLKISSFTRDTNNFLHFFHLDLNDNIKRYVGKDKKMMMVIRISDEAHA